MALETSVDRHHEEGDIEKNQQGIIDATSTSKTSSTLSSRKSHVKEDKAESQIAPSGGGGATPTKQEQLVSGHLKRRTLCTALLIVVLGAAASAALLAIGISDARQEQNDLFEGSASELVDSILNVWSEYESVGKWIHAATTGTAGNVSAQTFRQYYEHAISDGLAFQAASLILNASHAERSSLEQDTIRNYGGSLGFTGLEPDPDDANTSSVQPRSVQPFYFVVHLIEPVQGNEAAIDFDLYSSAARRTTIHAALDQRRPAVTDRLVLVQETDETAYSVLLMHPGIVLSNTDPAEPPRHLCNMVIRIPNLLERAALRTQHEKVSVFLFDQNPAATSGTDPSEPQYLGGIEILEHSHGEIKNYTHISNQDLTMESIVDANERRTQSFVVQVAHNKKWSILVVASSDSYQPQIVFVVLGGCIVLFAAMCLALWVYTHTLKVVQVNQIKSQAQAERAQLIVQNAQQTATFEQELNDFIAHEVRNPITAASAACSFVETAVEEREPLVTEDARKAAREDVAIIRSSLTFINDLLRDMLDMHRASSKKIKIKFKPTDVLKDVFQPVDTMLYRRGCNFQVILECPPHLYVMSDPLRLKQIIFNLARNSVKFLTRGFIKLTASVVDGNVHLIVADSGEGIPEAKQKNLFSRYQMPLDTLCQGTGIGLCVCKDLSDLLNAELRLDESYHSGIPGQPGAKFVLGLNAPPLQLDEEDDDDCGASNDAEMKAPKVESSTEQKGQSLIVAPPLARSVTKEESDLTKLPETLCVLFVDDDLILRKLFARTIRKVAPLWKIEDASNGEIALRLVQKQNFDLIFMDQYMASVDKSLLGTETVREMRSKGVKSIICGLSANDVEEQFMREGADSFMFKPFPCEKSALIRELNRVLRKDTTL